MNPSATMKLLVCDVGFTSDIDGPGQRMVIYLKGCNLHCPWCALPETIAPEPEMLFYANRVNQPQQAITACPHGAVFQQANGVVRNRNICRTCDGRECLQSSSRAFDWVGRWLTVSDLVAQAIRYRMFFSRSGGVTVGGGEPTCQFDAAQNLLTALRAEGLNTAMETNGTHARLPDIFAVLNTLLIDLKHPDDAICRMVTGAGNTTVLANIRRRHETRGAMCVRIPLIPGFNDDPATIQQFGKVLAAIGALTVEVLPFHRRGEVKWRALGQAMPLAATATPSPEDVAAVCRQLAHWGLEATTI